ncbi:MAG TPA: protein kinase [Polyangiaceae bacterium]|nr:protein kinase [Polyangiaceae bacterium]
MSGEPERGTRLGSYELLVRIGRGGMAGVWVARGRPKPSEPEQLVAVKAMLPDLASNMEFRSMFLDEGQIVRSIDHPNVVRVYDVGESQGILYMAMEWVEGDSLHTLIAEANKRRPIPPEVAVRLIADTAAGLHAAHELRGWDGKLKEIVHCDVSPHNILIGLDGVVKLVDFGVAGAMNQVSTDDEVKIRGKFGYMSPEQAQAKALDRRSDIFSLGIVLFELTTGYRLFRGRDDRHTLELVTWGKIPRPSQVIPSYPEQLEAIVMRALERDLDKRYQTAEAFRDALETYLVEQRILVPAAGVKGLLRKVLGSKIEQRRGQIRSAIRALDGSQNAPTLVSEEAILTDADAVSVSVSQAGPPDSDPSVSQSRSLGAAFLPGDGSSGVQTLSQPSPAPPPRANKFLLIGTALGVLISGATFLVLGLNRNPSGPTPAQETSPAATNAPAPGPGTEHPAGKITPQDQLRGVNIDSLPEVATADGVLPTGVPRGPAGAPPPQGRPTEGDLANAAAVMREPKPGEAAKVTLSEDQPSDRVNAIANSVSLDDHGNSTSTGPAPTPVDLGGGTGGVDRATLASALGRAANMVGMCHRPGGASGSGKAVVTVGPNGHVQNVVILGALAGTPVGDCVANQFRNVKVSGFSGNSVTVSKGFVVPE